MNTMAQLLSDVRTQHHTEGQRQRQWQLPVMLLLCCSCSWLHGLTRV